MNEFHTDTRLEETRTGGYRVDVSDRWSVGAGANGGYLAGLLAKGLLTATGRGDLRSLTVHCLAPGTPGMAELQTGILRRTLGHGDRRQPQPGRQAARRGSRRAGGRS
ncbi:MAG: hypothetical protein R2710_12830 [Acidimicrobiales bacterium]